MTSLSLYKILSLSIVIKTKMAAMPMLAGVGLMMVCCSSSSVASMLMGGEEDPGGGGAGAGADTPTEYVYEFHIVSDNAHGDYGVQISDLKVDGTRVTSDNITFHIAPTDYACEHDTDTSYNCEGAMGYMDSAGAITIAAWNKETPPKKFFTITSPTKIGTIEISYHRPTYAPAMMIKENGVEILRDDSNKGSDGSPSPFPVTYTIP
jgi:hypothetical protein